MWNTKALAFPAQLRNDKHDKNNTHLTFDSSGIKYTYMYVLNVNYFKK